MSRDAVPHPERQVREALGLQVLSIEESKSRKPRISAVLIQSGMSLNGNSYPADVLRPAAPLYEGAKVMLDHSDGWFVPDTVRNVAAVISDARWDADAGAITGTIQPATELESGRLLLDLARAQLSLHKSGALPEDKSLFGFSHRARVTGEYREPDDGDPYYQVESIVEVLSVDAVVFPAAGGAMTSLGESRRLDLVHRLGQAGITPEEPQAGAPAPTRAEARRKVTFMAKKNSRTFDTSGILIQVEGIDRDKLEPALQAAAQVGHDAASEDAAQRIAALEADHARLEGERDGALARLAKYEEAERKAEELRALDALMVEKGVPELARAQLRDRIASKSLNAEQAEAVIDAYTEGLAARAANVSEDADVPADTQEGDVNPVEEAKRAGDALYESQFPGSRSN